VSSNAFLKHGNTWLNTWFNTWLNTWKHMEKPYGGFLKCGYPWLPPAIIHFLFGFSMIFLPTLHVGVPPWLRKPHPSLETLGHSGMKLSRKPRQVFLQGIPICSMVLKYLPTKLAHLWGKCWWIFQHHRHFWDLVTMLGMFCTKKTGHIWRFPEIGVPFY